jgi:hypothetical protein
MSLLVNLSSIFKLKSIIPGGLAPFVALCNLHSKNRCCSFFGLNNYLWVLKQFYSNQSLINDYKLGKITDDQFLDAVLDIFSFLKNNKKVDNPKKLLADAWNDLIIWDEESTAHLKQLLRQAQQGKTVFLMSNTNPLNMARILYFFEKACPEIHWNQEALGSDRANEPLALAPNIYLCLSYKYGLFKEGTPGLLRSIVAQQADPSSEITVVSQFPKDLEVAASLKLSAQSGTDFYASASPSNAARPAPTRSCAF